MFGTTSRTGCPNPHKTHHITKPPLPQPSSDPTKQSFGEPDGVQTRPRPQPVFKEQERKELRSSARVYLLVEPEQTSIE